MISRRRFLGKAAIAAVGLSAAALVGTNDTAPTLTRASDGNRLSGGGGVIGLSNAPITGSRGVLLYVENKQLMVKHESGATEVLS